jgi:hypothetical protein
MSKRILTMFAAVLLFAVIEGRAQEAVIPPSGESGSRRRAQNTSFVG